MQLPEVWKNLSPRYQISSFGQVKRLRHGVIRSNGRPFTKEEKILIGGLDSHGYRQVRIDGRLRHVHQLVAEVFIGPRPAGLETCHEDGNPLNCRFDNLRYDTHQNNVLDRAKHGTVPKSGLMTESQVLDVRERLKRGESNASIARVYKVDPSMISNIKRKKTWGWL